MKALSGLRILGFGVVVFTVSVTVCIWAGDKPPTQKPPTPAHAAFVVKIGWHASHDATCEASDMTADQIRAALHHVQDPFPPSRYNLKEWTNYQVTNKEGNLESCSESRLRTAEAPSAQRSVPAPEASRIRGNRTQTTAVAAFSTAADLQKFVGALNTAASSSSTATPAPTSPPEAK